MVKRSLSQSADAAQLFQLLDDAGRRTPSFHVPCMLPGISHGPDLILINALLFSALQ